MTIQTLKSYNKNTDTYLYICMILMNILTFLG